MLLESYELVCDSGGAGKNRGGLGSRSTIKLLSPATVFAFIEKTKAPHWGVNGGKEGLRNYSVVRPENGREYEIVKTSGSQLEAGCRIIATAGGGGGYGHPFDRDEEKVRLDVINGSVSIESARNDYGVVIDPSTLSVDKHNTQKLRAKRR
jgi:N-methylhydantoinase B